MLCPPHAQIRELGHGAYGTAVLMRNRETGEMVAVKFIERGAQARGLAAVLRRLPAHPAALAGAACCLLRQSNSTAMCTLPGAGCPHCHRLPCSLHCRHGRCHCACEAAPHSAARKRCPTPLPQA